MTPSGTSTISATSDSLVGWAKKDSAETNVARAHSLAETSVTAAVCNANQGAGAVSVTLGPSKPIVQRVGPLPTGPDFVQLGLLTILDSGEYIYNYNQQGPFGNILLSRVKAGKAALDAQEYEYLSFPPDSTTDPERVAGILDAKDAGSYGIRTSETTGRFTCTQYSSVTWNK